jgi:quercetin dioxygenase-like cupin family protein
MPKRKPPVLNYRRVRPAPMRRGAGWAKMDIRFIATDRTMGSRAACFWRTVFPPGAAHHKHLHARADEIFYMIRGRGMHGLGDREYPVRAGDVFYIPRGEVHWMRNVDPRHPVELVGVYVGAPNLRATGYVYVGEIEGPAWQAPAGRRRAAPARRSRPRARLSRR